MQAAESNRGVPGLTWCLQWGHRFNAFNSNLNPLTSFTASSRSTEFKDIFPWNIYQMITERVQISTSFVITELSKTIQWNRASRFEFDKKSMETEATTWLEFPNWGKAIVEQIPASEDRNKSKRVGLRVTVRDLSRKINHLIKIIWERKIIRKFTRSIISTRLAQPVLIMDVKVSKDKHISRWVDWENLIFSC